MAGTKDKSELGRTPSERGELGQHLWEVRKARGMTLRQVEDASGVSNAYLSQLENGEIKNASPQILHKLSEALKVDYEQLMQLAGHIKKAEATSGRRKGRLPTFSKEELTDEEEGELLKYLAFLRMRRGKKQ